MLMPVAAMHEERDLVTREYEIGTAGEIAAIKPKP
jgi:hypothetical protein